MKLYWTLSSIPELTGLSEEEQRRVWRICNRMTFRHWQIWATLALALPCVIGFAWLGSAAFALSGGGEEASALRILFNIAGAALWIATFSQIQASIGRRYLRKHRNELVRIA